MTFRKKVNKKFELMLCELQFLDGCGIEPLVHNGRFLGGALNRHSPVAPHSTVQCNKIATGMPNLYMKLFINIQTVKNRILLE